MAKAKRVLEQKLEFEDGGILQLKIWELPESNDDYPNGIKFSLFFGYPGKRCVGYDNHHGKPDHKHLGEKEFPYQFTTIDQLVDDFMLDVQNWRKEHEQSKHHRLSKSG